MVRDYKTELEEVEASVARYRYQIALNPPRDIRFFKQHFPREGGVFAPQSQKPDYYNPCKVWRELLSAVQIVDENDPESVLEFVNRWGVLRVGVETDGLFPYDGVRVTQRCLADLKAALDNFARAPNSHQSALAFTEFLNASLAGVKEGLKPESDSSQIKVTQLVTLEVRREGNQFRRQLRIHSLWGALIFALHSNALQGVSPIQCQSKGCTNLFWPVRNGNLYCSTRCDNREMQRAWRNRKKKKRKRKRLSVKNYDRMAS